MNQREPGYDSPALASYCKTSDTLQDSLAKFLMQILIKNAIENRTSQKKRLIHLYYGSNGSCITVLRPEKDIFKVHLLSSLSSFRSF